MRNYILIAVALTVAASGCMGQQTSNDNGDLNRSQGSQNNTVFYTDSGFQPETIEIERGETVTWLDRASREMWVASDVHPSHTVYDGSSLSQHCGTDQDVFDQCTSGEKFSFTFEKTGEWGYHNHRAAADIGTVKVN